MVKILQSDWSNGYTSLLYYSFSPKITLELKAFKTTPDASAIDQEAGVQPPEKSFNRVNQLNETPLHWIWPEPMKEKVANKDITHEIETNRANVV